MAVDTVVKNGKIFTAEGQYPEGVVIAIDKGKIVAITSENYCPKSNKVIDAKGNCILPGFVDPHVHMAYPAYVPRETNTLHESQAFAAGGVTTITYYMMVPKDNLKACQEYVSHWEKSGYVDLAISPTLISLQGIEEIEALANYGTNGFKLMMPYKGLEAIPGLGGDVTDGVMFQAMEQVARLVKKGYNIHLRIHCETAEIYWVQKEKWIKEGKTPRSYNEVRPRFIEQEAMHRSIFYANLLGCPLYVVHMTIKEGVDIIAEAQAKGIDVVGETCPQYLILNEDNADILKSKVNPPIRTKEDNERLWKGLRDGILTFMGTDHAPCIRGACPSCKVEPAKPPVWDVKCMGMSGAEWWMPIMLSEGVNKGRLSLEKVIALCSTNTAKKYGLYPKKGAIAVGSDADLVIADLNKEVKVPEKPVYSYTDYCAYAGFTFKGWPTLTMLRGTVIFEDGKIVGKAGYGRYCPAKVK